MKITFEQAVYAKSMLRSKLNRPAWLCGMGLGLEGDAHFVKVNVAAITSDVTDAVPEEIHGVPVRIEAVGIIRVSPV